MVLLNMWVCGLRSLLFFSKINNQYYFEHDKISHHACSKKPLSSNRSRILRFLFEWSCYKLQYNFETLEAHVLTFALERKFASINVVDEISFENDVSSFFLTMFILLRFIIILNITSQFPYRKLCCLLIVTKLSRKHL